MITAHVIHFTNWSAAELRRIQNAHALMPLANWQAAVRKRDTWILIRLHEYIAAAGEYPAGYELRRRGVVIETGRFAWHEGRPERTEIVTSKN